MSRTHVRVGRLPVSLAAILILGACAGMPGKIGGGGGTSLSLAERAVNSGDFETAAALYQQAFDANPNSTDALLGLGRSYAGLGQFSRSEQALAEAERRSPRDPAIQLELARARLAGGNAAAALAHLDKAAARTPRNIQVITARGIALDRLSRHKEAQETYRRGLKLAPTDFALLSNLGLSLGLSGQTAEGVRILSELNRDKQANARTRGNLALVYGLAGKDREAAATLSRDLNASQVQSNVAYYRELRALLQKGKPIGNFDQPATAAQQPRPAAVQTAATTQATTAPAIPAAPRTATAPRTAATPLTAAAPEAAAAPQAAPTPETIRPPLADAAPLVGAFTPASGSAPPAGKAADAPEASRVLPPESPDAPPASPQGPASNAQ